MQTRWIGLVIVGAVALTAARPCLAWGNDGHKTVGAIADSLLAGTNAERQVREILTAKETLSSVAIWADCAKGYCGKLAKEMSEFVDANPGHHSYHYTDVPFAVAAYRDAPAGVGPDDIVHILRECVQLLASQEQRSTPHGLTRRQALLLMTHLVGDLHQPLHVGTAYVGKHKDFVTPKSDYEVKKKVVGFTTGDNDLLHGGASLHSYWDGVAVSAGMTQRGAKSVNAYAARLQEEFAAPSAPAGPADTWPETWADESLAASNAAHDTVRIIDAFQSMNSHGKPYTRWHIGWGPHYPETTRDEAAKAVAKAGYRLAQLLKAIWP